METDAIGVIGGTGLYDIDGLEDVKEVAVSTPYGDPSDKYRLGMYKGRQLVFLPRHGRNHHLLPSEINHCANIYGFKSLGVRWLISTSAVGSMREAIEPGHMVIVDQFIDRTKARRSTFFGDGAVGHAEFADPVCGQLANILHESAKTVGLTVHNKCTYVCIEGPQFSTRAESKLYRQWGVDVIGMTNIPEAKLAREAGLCYATLATATDYDCWHESEDDVSTASIIEILRQNVDKARKTVIEAIGRIPQKRDCSCVGAGSRALMTDLKQVSADVRERLELVLAD